MELIFLTLFIGSILFIIISRLKKNLFKLSSNDKYGILIIIATTMLSISMFITIEYVGISVIYFILLPYLTTISISNQ